jgi:ABC-type branched-subunit amino acid transport system ATPase component
MTAACFKSTRSRLVYKRVITAVQGVTLLVGERQIVAILGTNARGKTTTLRAISGFSASTTRASRGIHNVQRYADRQ